MPYTDWMNGFTNRGDLTLADITFPASHDAGLSEAPNCYVPYSGIAVRSGIICQYYDIAGQLDAGSRAFDLRCAIKDGILRTFHGEGAVGAVGMGGWGQTAVSIFQQVDTFLTNHTGEIVILRISHTAENAGAAQAVTTHINANRLLRCGPRNIAKMPLNQLRGKAIAIFDEDALSTVNPYNGLHRLTKYTPGGSAGGMPICGKYAGKSAGFKKMVKTAIECGNEHGTHQRLVSGKHDHLFMVYWQLAVDVKEKTTRDQDNRVKNLSWIDETKGTHYNLDYILNVHRGLFPVGAVDGVGTAVNFGNYQYHRPNYINLDFVNDISCGKVIEFNNGLLRGDRL